MFYKYLLIVLCTYSVVLHVLRIVCLLIKPGFLMKFKLIAGSPSGKFDQLLYYMAMIVVLLQVIFDQLNMSTGI